MNILSIFLAAILFVVSLFGLGRPQNLPVSGGITDRTDPLAPKVIQSKELSSFRTYFFLYDSYDESRDGFYDFSIKPNDSEGWTLEAKGPYDITIPVDADVLAGIQAIIEEYQLVDRNGVHRTTGGLPPEYGPMDFSATYVSGETLTFHQNNDPRADWSTALKTYLEKVLVEQGHPEVLPPKESTTIVHLSMTFNVGSISHHYSELTSDRDEKTCLYHSAYDMETSKDMPDHYASLQEDFYEGLQALFEEYDFDSLHAPETVSFSLQSTPEGFLEIYVDYENGRQIYAELTAEDLPENWSQMRDAFMEYCDQYMEAHAVTR